MGKELAPKAHVQVKFCSSPIRSQDYFPERKPAFTILGRYFDKICRLTDFKQAAKRLVTGLILGSSSNFFFMSF